MNRHEACRLLAKTVSTARETPFEELAKRIGALRSERERGAAGEEFLLEVRVDRDDAADRIRVRATVDSVGTFRLERVEDEVTVRPDGVA